jgi:hypothetical protein
MRRVYKLKNEITTLRALVRALKNRQVSLKPIKHSLPLKSVHIKVVQINTLLKTELNPSQLAEVKTAALPVDLKPLEHFEVPN